jgi:hypothetical protein
MRNVKQRKVKELTNGLIVNIRTRGQFFWSFCITAFQGMHEHFLKSLGDKLNFMVIFRTIPQRKVYLLHVSAKVS